MKVIPSNATTANSSNNPVSAVTCAITATVNASNNQRYRYQNEIQAMMYTFGDVRNPLSSTTLLVEDIVLGQMIELVQFNNEKIVILLILPYLFLAYQSFWCGG